jgi:hypothetical protein
MLPIFDSAYVAWRTATKNKAAYPAINPLAPNCRMVAIFILALTTALNLATTSFSSYFSAASAKAGYIAEFS